MAIDKNKLVSLGALQKAAEALKNAANQAAADAANAEAGRAQKAEQDIEKKADDNAAAIAILKGGAEEEGSVAKAVADAVKAEADRADGVEKGLAARIAVNEAFVAAQPAIDKAQDGRLSLLEEMMGLGGVEGDKTAIEELQESIEAVEDKADAAQAGVNAINAKLDGVEGQDGLVARIAANENAIGVLNGDENAEGSVKKQIADAINAVNQAAEGLAGRVTAAEGEIDQLQLDVAKLDGADTVEGSVKKQIKDAIEAVNQAADGLADRVEAVESFRDITYPAAELKVREDFAAADVKVLEDAQKYADDAITALVDSAPDAMNTLKELADAIKGNEDIYKAYVEEHAQAMAQQKADLQKEIDDDVKAVVEAQKLVNDAQAEANEDFEARIDANEEFVKAQPGVDAIQDGRIQALEEANAKGGAIAEAIQAAQDAADAAQGAADNAQAAAEAAQGAADAAQGEVDAVEGRVEALEGKVGHDVDGENPATGLFLEVDEAKAAAKQAQDEVDLVEGRATALESFVQGHDHSVMEQGIADNKAAIEAEVGKEGVQGARDAAIAAALENYSTTAEMKNIIGAVVQSLNLEITDDNEVKLTLGSEENGIALATAKLGMATDTDINDMLAEIGINQGE